jgi:hypothetical protein
MGIFVSDIALLRDRISNGRTIERIPTSYLRDEGNNRRIQWESGWEPAIPGDLDEEWSCKGKSFKTALADPAGPNPGPLTGFEDSH